jgi:hypothetical protein
VALRTDGPLAPRAESFRATSRDDWISVAFGGWLIIGVFADGWAHLNLSTIDSFFTPWHAVLYSGFLASAGEVTWLTLRNLRRGAPVRAAIPEGYRLGAVGVGIFAVGGVTDMMWHLAFGVEAGIEALLSPTHLVLLTGAFLLITSAARSTWRRTDEYAASPASRGMADRFARDQFPAVLSVTWAASLAAFFLMYVSAFTTTYPALRYVPLPQDAAAEDAAELPVVAGLSAFLLTSILLVVGMLILLRQGPLPRGSVLVLVATVAWLTTALTDFAWQAVAGSAACTLAAALLDSILTALDHRRGPTAAGRLIVAAMLLPLLVGPARLLGLQLVDRVGWSPELVGGAVVLSTLVCGVLGLLATPISHHDHQAV